MGFQDYFRHFQLRKSSGWGKNKPKNHWSCIAHDRGQVLTTEDRLIHSYWILKRHLIHPLMNSLKTICLAMELVARLKWIDTFLCFRQRVVVNGVKSDLSLVRCYSIYNHGTVLGLLLFSLYINDISSDTESEIRLLADDCVCY